MKKLVSLLLITVLIGSLMTGCKDKPGDAPVLPPAESMLIDFSNFVSGNKSADVLLPKGVENSNWEFAALVAGYWNGIIFTTLIVPVMSFDKAIDQTPVYLDNKTWQWSYSTSVFTITYKARLTGQIRASDVLWKMYIKREGTSGFNEFLWFEGTSALDGKSGDWTLYHSYAFQDPVLTIDWQGNGTNISYIKYEYVRETDNAGVTDPYNGSYIEYGTATGTFDSYYNIYLWYNAAFSNMNVEWSSTGLNGRVKCQAFFGDAIWHCWDGNYVNITCP